MASTHTSMRHAILITAYTDFVQLISLVEMFDYRFDIYIHIDKKAKISNTCFHLLEALPNVKVVDRVYAVNWGGRNHIDAILWLCREAIKKSQDVSFFHLISGTDLLVKPIEAFCNFFEQHKEDNFLDYFLLPNSCWAQGGFNRLEFKHPMDRINIKTANDYSVYCRFLNWQIKKGYVRTLPTHNIYGGSTWWSLSRSSVLYLCSHYNWMGWYDRLKNCFVPEEMYVQTILLNSKYRSTIINNNLRYIVCEYRNGNNPAVLDESDIPLILQSNAFFARKIDSKKSDKLISFIKNLQKK